MSFVIWQYFHAMLPYFDSYLDNAKRDSSNATARAVGDARVFRSVPEASLRSALPRFPTNLHNSCTELRRAGRARQEISQWNGVEELVGFQNKTNPAQNRKQNQKKD